MVCNKRIASKALLTLQINFKNNGRKKTYIDSFIGRHFSIQRNDKLEVTRSPSWTVFFNANDEVYLLLLFRNQNFLITNLVFNSRGRI